jgi:hypothetical protein
VPSFVPAGDAEQMTDEVAVVLVELCIPRPLTPGQGQCGSRWHVTFGDGWNGGCRLGR